jgi:hypothetical protein
MATKAKKVAVTSLNAALKISGVSFAAKRVVSLQKSLTRTGKEMGAALMELRKQFHTRIKRGGTYFSQFLKRKGIARSTAFYAMNAAKGKKRSTPRKKAGNRIPTRTPYQEFVMELKAFANVDKAFELITRAWKKAYPNAAGLSLLGMRKPSASVRPTAHIATA